MAEPTTMSDPLSELMEYLQNKQKEQDPEIAKIVNENFWDLI